MKWRHDLDPDAMTDEERRAKNRYDAYFVFETMEVNQMGDIAARPQEILAGLDKLPCHWCGVIGGNHQEGCPVIMRTKIITTGNIPAEGANPSVDHPAHYNQHPSGVECIDIVRWMGFNLGNVVKYLWRDGLKDIEVELQDLEKAAWYLNNEINRRKANDNSTAE